MVSFSSMNDAFTTSMDVQIQNKYKRPDVFSQITDNSPSSTIKPFEANYEPFKNVDDIINNISEPVHDDADITCDDIIDHIKECEYCRSQLDLDDPYHIPEYLQNTILYIIMGIFILFLLDIFVRIGKLLK